MVTKVLALSDTGDYIVEAPTALPISTTDTPLMNGVAAVGASGKWADGLHVHPTDTSRAGAPTITATASAALTAGQWVSLHNVAGVRSVRPADCTDATKPVHGYVLANFSSSATATVYVSGVNSLIPLGSYVAADIGKPVFLGTAGATTLTPTATTGQLLQQVGWVDVVGATVSVDLIKSPGIVRA